MSLDPIILAELQRGGPPLWVPGRPYRVGQCVRSPADLQQYVRRTNGSGATDPKDDSDNYLRWSKELEAAIALVGAAVLDVSGKADGIQATVNAMNAAKGIKSVQRGITTPNAGTNGAISETMVTIAAVNPAKCTLSLLSGGLNTSTMDPVTVRFSLRLVSDTRLGVTSGYSIAYSGGGFPCSWEVVEWH